jgi:radical SAM superfamily enzyme YgiQ (UPF0313 family)
MAKILFISPNKWGRGITPIWIASHYAILKKDHEVFLFDCTFYQGWTENENNYNTKNEQYKNSGYNKLVKFNSKSIYADLQEKIDLIKPDFIFWSALSSHIHGEGEYVNIQHGYNLISKVNIYKAILITGGLQATASPEITFKNFNKISFLISGESEFVLKNFLDFFDQNKDLRIINGISYKDKKNNIIINQRQNIIQDLDLIPDYDYSLFDRQIFLRPYNGDVVNAIDYEISRGCIYTCTYCVETVIQKYYGFEEKTPRGALKSAKKYLRNKSAEKVYRELKSYKENFNITLVRFQDTNFLTINSSMLKELEDLILKNPLGLKIYIETRPEGINEKSVMLLKNLGVDGVGMGIELAGNNFRENNLNRFVEEDKIIKAFDLLKKYNIKRTTYNIIGLPEQNEDSILDTINFNKLLNPENITVAFYTPYVGTAEQIKSTNMKYFDDYEFNLDPQLRSLSKDTLISLDKLIYYKKNFSRLVRN